MSPLQWRGGIEGMTINITGTLIPYDVSSMFGDDCRFDMHVCVCVCVPARTYDSADTGVPRLLSSREREDHRDL